MKNGKFIGIDFGTTNTAVYQLIRDEYGENSLILAENGQFPFPSMLAENDVGEVIFGSEVKNGKEKYNENGKLITSFKSKLVSDEKILLKGEKMSPTKVTEYFLRLVKKSIKDKYGVDIAEAVLSFPVGFPPEARKRLIKAAETADIKVKDLVSESTAVYLAMLDEVKGFSKVMVIDWGGGTLDISVLEADEQKVREIAVGGVDIGGDDIDEALAKYIHNRLNLYTENRFRFDEMPPEQRAKMRSLCEETKMGLSDPDEDNIITIRNYGNYGTKTLKLKNAELEDVIKPIINKNVSKIINDTLEKAELMPSNIDAVIIAGGSSNLRLFEKIIVNIFGREKILRNESEIQFLSAKGAAVMQSIDGAYKLNDDVGVELSDGSVFPILKKDEDGVGSKTNTFTFSLTDDSLDAHFIFKNGGGQVEYAKASIPTKGYFNEKIEVSANIDKEQVANIHIHNSTVGKDLQDKNIEINKLMFYYDLSGKGE